MYIIKKIIEKDLRRSFWRVTHRDSEYHSNRKHAFYRIAHDLCYLIDSLQLFAGRCPSVAYPVVCPYLRNPNNSWMTQ